ncbi:MAG: penicillin-binding protein [Actinophytocola sp.]|uniref:transglycosylase domain-containing protein n=1 Tax=Actinophytocola sp. TaxID=1872138 RepID=UPI0013269A0D|nr:transglycosylase domain-containing protein [Actinophytocola sp.]MPZ85413.1 penicillin-binding protein [Actinophytocola sp.]
MRNLVRFGGAFLLAGVLLAALLSPFVLGGGAAAAKVAASAAQITPASVAGEVPLVTTVTDRDGNPIATVFDQYRLPVTAEEIAPVMKAAVVSIEDRRFYSEHGVDPTAVLRALVNDVAGGATEGGSTIAQQFVKNYLIAVVDRDDPAAQAADRADTLTRKVREARSAIQLDHDMSKDDILAGYLNVVEFTGRVYGVQAAAHAYFGTTADKLDLPQAALLAGMVNNPTIYDPYAHPKAALIRRDMVLDAMVDTHAIDARTATTAKAADLGVLPDGPSVPPSTCAGAAPDAGFLCQYALSYLRSAGLTADRLATGGFTIRTTMDPAASAAAKKAVEANVPTTQDGVANTMAVIAPGTTSHEVLAMVANRNLGTDIERGETTGNLVADVSDPFGAGSVFKIFTAAAALESGAARLDTPLPNPSIGCFDLPDRPCYPVHNDGSYPDPITLADGLATSPNTAFVGLETKVGMSAVLDMADRLGLRNTLRTNDAGQTPDSRSDDPQRSRPQSTYFRDKPSFTLGNSPVSPLELANVSATLMSGGMWCPPNPIQSVVDRFGHPVDVPTEPCEQVVPVGLANTLVAGLSKDTVSGTTAASAAAAGWTRPGIGKTGTTQDSESVAFVGGANGYAVSSLVFADGPNPRELCPGPPVHLGDCGNGAFGGTVAAPPYFAAMATILAGRPDQPVPGPDPKYLE